jgi:hypothetical protein
MANAIEDYVEAFEDAKQFVHLIDVGNSALDELIRVRAEVVSLLAEIQASSAYTQDIKDAASTMAADLRQAIIDFANSL